MNGNAKNPRILPRPDFWVAGLMQSILSEFSGWLILTTILASSAACTGGMVKAKISRGEQLDSLQTPEDRESVDRLLGSSGNYANRQTASAFPISGRCISNSTVVRVTVAATGVYTDLPCDPVSRNFTGTIDVSVVPDGEIQLIIEYLSDQLAQIYSVNMTINKLTAELPAFTIPPLTDAGPIVDFPPVAGASSYNIQIIPVGGGPPAIDIVVSNNSIDITPLDGGVAYRVYMSAIDIAGNTFPAANSGAVTWTPPVPTPPGAPTGVSGTSGNAVVALTWSAPASNGGRLISDYVIQYSSNGGGNWTAFNDGTSTSTSVTVTGLSNGTSYIFRVAAVNAVGTGSYSANSPSVTPLSAPGAPTGVGGTAGNAQVALTWSAPASTGGSAITDYVIQYSSNGGGSWTTFSDGTSTSTSANVTSLSNGTTYIFRVATVNSVGTGTYSSNSASLVPATSPGAPTGVSGTSGNAQVALAWASPVSTGGSAITDYLIQYSSDSGSNWTTFNDGTSPSTSTTVTGLSNGTSYIFRIAAVNSIGTGSYSQNSSTVTPLTTPGAPTGVSGTSGNGQVALTWSSPASTGGSAITDYRIQYSSDGGANWSTFNDGTSTSTSATVTSLSNGTTYIFRVAALNSAGAGSYSANSAGVTPGSSPPGAPTGVSGTAGNTKVALTWSAPASNGGSAITDYIVEYSSDSGSNWTTFNDGTSTSTTIIVTGLTNGTSYVFRVAAVNSAGTGNYSANSSEIKLLVFVSRWKTDNITTGSTPATQIKLPLVASGTYNFNVEWGDGTQSTITTWNQAQATHTYNSSGTYTVTISGIITGWKFGGEGDRSKILEISSWGPFKFGNTGQYFTGANNLAITATDKPDMAGTTTMSEAFRDCSSLTTVPNMDTWDMSAVTDMSLMFMGATAFNQPIGSWNTSSARLMQWMFYNATAFNQAIGGWNTALVQTTALMFRNASAFNQPIGAWNTASITDMSSMFNGASAFNQPIGSWNTAAVTNFRFMFAQASAFNQSLDNWNTGAVTNMENMFFGASAFNKAIGMWNTGSVTKMGGMFLNASAFNQPIESWNTGAVTQMQYMFTGATSFNQTLSNWNVANVTTMESMFDATGLSTANYDAVLIGWSKQNVVSGVLLGASGRTYSAGVASAARSTLVSSKSWSISDGGQNSDYPTAGAFTATTNLTSTSFTLNWTGTTDTVSGLPGNYDYLVCDGSSAAEIDTVPECLAQSPALVNWTANLSSTGFTGATAGNTYFFNVVVRDGSGNMVIYNGVSVTTPP
jgi:surface protein